MCVCVCVCVCERVVRACVCVCACARARDSRLFVKLLTSQSPISQNMSSRALLSSLSVDVICIVPRLPFVTYKVGQDTGVIASSAELL